MSKLLFASVVLTNLFSVLFAQSQYNTHIILDKTNKEISFPKMLQVLEETPLIFFGEEHNQALSHWAFYKMIRYFNDKKGGQVVLAMEMFENDVQVSLNEYLAGYIQEKNFTNEAKVWKNYSTDYAPIINYCKEEKLSIIASNIPRKYANAVYHKGWEILDSIDGLRKFIPKEFDTAYFSEYKSKFPTSMADHMTENMIKAQYLKDFTMAYSLSKLIEPSKTILHLNGALHSDNNFGIPFILEKLFPKTPYAVVSSKTINFDDKKNTPISGDFTFLIDQDISKTH